MLPKTSPNYLQYKIHKRRLLSWIHFIAIILNALNLVINLAPVSLSNKKSELLRLSKSDVSEDNCHGKCLRTFAPIATAHL